MAYKTFRSIDFIRGNYRIYGRFSQAFDGIKLSDSIAQIAMGTKKRCPILLKQRFK